jgi:hypothetical protein
MPPIVRALIFMAIGAGLQAIIGFAILPWLLDASGGGMVALALIGTIGAAAFGFVTGLAGIYALRPLSIFYFVIDTTWSALNTVTGLLFLIWCAIKGTYQTPTETTQDWGTIHFTGAALGGAGATTIGTVMGGQWLLHETVHITQGRIFGPFYWPTYLISYALNMLVRFLTIRFHDPHWEAYGRVVMEDWAYAAAPHSSFKISAWIGFFFLGLLNALAIAVAFAPIPVAGAIPAAIGLGLVPWWIGLIVLVIYALVRSFFKKSEPHAESPPAPAGATPPVTDPWH